MAKQHDFKVKNGLVVADSGTFGNTLTGTDAVFSGSVTASNILDSASVIGIIASEGLDSNLVISIVDSAYVKLRDRFQDSGLVTSTVTKTYVDALNIDADTLDGQTGTFYLDYNNFTNVPSISSLDSAGVISLIDSDYIELRRPPETIFTVVNNGSSAYTFTGDGFSSGRDNPTLYLTRGKTYKFGMSASGHPFQIRVSNGGSAYNTGVTNNGAQTGNIFFTPDMNAPASLVYQCTIHGGMVGNIVILDETNPGLDSANVISLIDSAYVQARQTASGSGVDSAYVASQISASPGGVTVTEVFDSAGRVGIASPVEGDVAVQFGSGPGVPIGVTYSYSGAQILSWSPGTNSQTNAEFTLNNSTFAAAAKPGDVIVLNGSVQWYNSYSHHHISPSWNTIQSGNLILGIKSVDANTGNMTVLIATTAYYSADGANRTLNSDLKDYFDNASNPRGLIPSNAVTVYDNLGSNSNSNGRRLVAYDATLYKMFTSNIQSGLDTSAGSNTSSDDVSGNVTALTNENPRIYLFNDSAWNPYFDQQITGTIDSSYLSGYIDSGWITDRYTPTITEIFDSDQRVAITSPLEGDVAVQFRSNPGIYTGISHDFTVNNARSTLWSYTVYARSSNSIVTDFGNGRFQWSNSTFDNQVQKGDVIVVEDGFMSTNPGVISGGVNYQGYAGTFIFVCHTPKIGAAAPYYNITAYAYDGNYTDNINLSLYSYFANPNNTRGSIPSNAEVAFSYINVNNNSAGSSLQGRVAKLYRFFDPLTYADGYDNNGTSNILNGSNDATFDVIPNTKPLVYFYNDVPGQGSAFRPYVQDQILGTIDSAYVQARSGAIDSASVTVLIDSAYINARTSASGIDSAAVTSIIDSAYINARTSGIDSAAVTSIIDSAYVVARAGGGGGGTVDSAYVTSIIDSASLPLTQKFYHFTADSGQTTFSGFDDDSDTLAYTAGALAIYLNGILLVDSADYTASNGTSITLTDASVAGDILTVQRFGGNSIFTNAIPFSQTFYHFTATGGQTTFSGSDDDSDTLQYSAGHIAVYLNGILLVDSADYTASNGTSIVLTDPAVNGDVLSILKFGGNTVGVDSAGIINLIDSAYIQARTVAGTDSAAIIELIDSAYVQARQITYDFLDSAEAINLIDSSYVQSRQITYDFLDSAEAINLIDSAYIQTRQLTYDFLDSAEVITLIDSAYVQARQITYDFLDSAEVITLIDSAYINARVDPFDSSHVLNLVDSAYIQLRDRFQDSAGILSIVDSNYVIQRVTKSDLDMQGNKVLFANVYDSVGSLPSATTYHGMFAHVHATGAGYFAHAGNWTRLANQSELNSYDSTNTIGIIDSAYVQARQITYDFLDSGEAINLIDSAYIQARQITYDFLDSGEVINLIDSAYVQARQTAGGGGGGGSVDSAQTIALIEATIDSDYIGTKVDFTRGEFVNEKSQYTATAAQTVFNHSSIDPTHLDVYLNGILQVADDDYTASTSAVTFTTGVDSGYSVTIVEKRGRILTQRGLVENKYYFTTPTPSTSITGTDDNGTTLDYSDGFLDVYLNGILLKDSDDYSTNAGTTVTLVSATDSNDLVTLINRKGVVVSPNVKNYEFTADSAQTLFTGSDINGNTLSYVPDAIQVHLNGILLRNIDYTANNGSSILLDTGAEATDEVTISAFSNPGQNMDLYQFTADSGQTVFSGNDLQGKSLAYMPGNIQVFLNGLLLNDSDDYTALNGVSVNLTSGTDASDEIKIAAFTVNTNYTPLNQWVKPSFPYSASAGDKIFVDTSTAKTVTLPPSATMGEEIRIIDATGNASTNNITVSRNGHNIQGATSDLTINIDRAGIGLVYYDSAQGWILIEN